MEVDLDNTYEMMMMKLMIMMMIIAVTQSVFKLGPPDFTSQVNQWNMKFCQICQIQNVLRLISHRNRQ